MFLRNLQIFPPYLKVLPQKLRIFCRVYIVRRRKDQAMVRTMKVGINLDSSKGNIEDWEIKGE